VFGLRENKNVACAQEAMFQASEHEKTLQENFLWVSLDAFFHVFCEAWLVFPPEWNADFFFIPNSKMRKLSKRIHSFAFPLKILHSKQTLNIQRVTMMMDASKLHYFI